MRYNIELRTQSTVRETLPIESEDLTALRVQVAQFVGALLQDHAQQIWIDEDGASMRPMSLASFSS